MKPAKLVQVMPIPEPVKIGGVNAAGFALIVEDQDGNKYMAAVACLENYAPMIQKAIGRPRPVELEIHHKIEEKKP